MARNVIRQRIVMLGFATALASGGAAVVAHTALAGGDDPTPPASNPTAPVAAQPNISGGVFRADAEVENEAPDVDNDDANEVGENEKDAVEPPETEQEHTGAAHPESSGDLPEPSATSGSDQGSGDHSPASGTGERDGGDHGSDGAGHDGGNG